MEALIIFYKSKEILRIKNEKSIYVIFLYDIMVPERGRILKHNRILVVEDDKDIIEILELYLTNNGFEVKKATNGKEALNIIEKDNINLIIADMMMPVMNGYELIKKVRQSNNIPIIILSAKSMEEDKISGLDIGADAYITKPFKPLEVVANVKAILRRCYKYEEENNKKIRVRDLEFDENEYSIKKNGRIIPLTNTEIRILVKMMREPEKTFTKEQLYECINEGYFQTDANTIMVHISNIRNKLKFCDENEEEYIKTIRGIGYKIVLK